MNPIVLDRICEIMEYKMNRIEHQINLQKKELNQTSERITDLLSRRDIVDEDNRLDSSKRWLADYKSFINDSLIKELHRFADRSNDINELRFELIKNNQKKEILTRLIDKIRKEQDITNLKKEEEDVEEQCSTRQFL